MIFLLVPMDLGMLHIGGTVLPTAHLIAGIIFIIASTTDWIDGYYARKYQLVTNLGKFLDPLADKLMVTAALVSLVSLQLVPAWMVIIILAREFAVTGIRLVAAAEGEVIAASQIAKWKTATQIIATAVLLLHNVFFAWLHIPFGYLLLWAAVILTVISGYDYFMKNKNFLLK